MQRGSLVLLGAVLSVLSAAASAGDESKPLQMYYGVFGNYMVPDSARHDDRTIGGQGTLGFKFSARDAIEIDLFAADYDHRTNLHNDPQVGLAAQFVTGALKPSYPHFSLGLGGVWDRNNGDSRLSPLLTAGAGYNFAALKNGDIPRLDFKWDGVLNKTSDSNRDQLDDFRVSIGLLFGLPRPERARMATAAANASPAQVAAAATGPDSDGDGVPDTLDRCPKTPLWQRVDQYGCGADQDHDGVFDGADLCPDTPMGEKADRLGCSPSQRDQDGDGVSDAMDKCADTPKGLEVLPDGCVDINKVVLSNVHFEVDSDALTVEAYKILTSVAKSLAAHPDIKIEIAGHTDATGTAKYNLDLSEHRANVVRDFLVYADVDPARVTAKGYGETKPLAPNDSDIGRSRNRRVEFHILQQP